MRNHEEAPHPNRCFILITEADDIQLKNAAYRLTYPATPATHPRDGAGRIDEVFLRSAERLAPARRPSCNDHGSYGQDARKDTDERPLLPEARLRRCGQFLEEILVGVGSGKASGGKREKKE